MGLLTKALRIAHRTMKRSGTLAPLGVVLALAACGGQSPSAAQSPTATPRAAATQSHFRVGETVRGPSGVDLKVISTRFDPAGDYFPLPAGGRWLSLQMTMYNGGKQIYAAGDIVTQSMAFDFQVRSQASGSIGPSGAQTAPQISGPILPGETASGWMSFAVPATGPLRLVWVPASAVVELAV